MQWNDITIGKNDRAVLLGSTGSGKTTLARRLVEDQSKPYSVVYDPKASLNINDWVAPKKYTDFSDLVWAKEKRLVYRPDIYEALDPRQQDEFFLWVYESMHRRLLIDEAYSLLGGSTPSFHLQACLARGRERGISTIICAQRPKRIPLLLLSESEHIYVFRVGMPEDRHRCYELTGIDPMEQFELKDFQFIYFNCRTGKRSGVLTLDLDAAEDNRKAR